MPELTDLKVTGLKVLKKLILSFKNPKENSFDFSAETKTQGWEVYWLKNFGYMVIYHQVMKSSQASWGRRFESLEKW